MLIISVDAYKQSLLILKVIPHFMCFYKILCIQYTLPSLENLIITASNDAEYCQCLAARTE